MDAALLGTVFGVMGLNLCVFGPRTVGALRGREEVGGREGEQALLLTDGAD